MWFCKLNLRTKKQTLEITETWLPHQQKNSLSNVVGKLAYYPLVVFAQSLYSTTGCSFLTVHEKTRIDSCLAPPYLPDILSHHLNQNSVFFFFSKKVQSVTLTANHMHKSREQKWFSNILLAVGRPDKK